MKKILKNSLLFMFSLIALAIASVTTANAAEGDKWKIDVTPDADGNTYYSIDVSAVVTNPKTSVYPQGAKVNLYERGIDGEFKYIYSQNLIGFTYTPSVAAKTTLNYQFKTDCQYYVSYSFENTEDWPYTVESSLEDNETKVEIKLLSPQIPATYTIVYQDWNFNKLASFTKNAYAGDVFTGDELEEIANQEDLGYKFKISMVDYNVVGGDANGKTGFVVEKDKTNTVTVTIQKYVSVKVNYYYDGLLYKSDNFEDVSFYKGQGLHSIYNENGEQLFELAEKCYSPELNGYIRNAQVSANGIDYGSCDDISDFDTFCTMQDGVYNYTIDIKFKSNLSIWFSKFCYNEKTGFLEQYTDTIENGTLYPTKFEEITQEKIIEILKDRFGDEFTKKIGDSAVESFDVDGTYGTSVSIVFEEDKIPDTPATPDPIDPTPDPDPIVPDPVEPEPEEPVEGTIKITTRYNIPLPNYANQPEYYTLGGASDYFKVKNWRYILVNKNNEVVKYEDVEMIGYRVNEILTTNDLFFDIPEGKFEDYKLYLMPLDKGENNATYEIIRTDYGFQVILTANIDKTVKTHIVVNGVEMDVVINDAKIGDTDARIEYLIKEKVKAILDNINSYGLNEWRIGVYVTDENTGERVFCHGFVLTVDDADEVEAYKYIEYTKLVTIYVDGKEEYNFEISEDDITAEIVEEALKGYTGGVDFTKVKYVDTIYGDNGNIDVYYNTIEDVEPEPDPIVPDPVEPEPEPEPTPKPEEPTVPEEPKVPEQPKEEPKQEQPKVEDTKVEEVAVEPIKTTAPQTGDENKNIPYYVISGVAVLGIILGIAYIKSTKEN